MITGEDLTAGLIAAITAYVDVEAAPPGQPTAHVVFGTTQPRPAVVAAERYHRGLAPVIILTGGVNRDDGIVEAREFHRIRTAHDVPIARSGSKTSRRRRCRMSSSPARISAPRWPTDRS
jgi:hypothetical protein